MAADRQERRARAQRHLPTVNATDRYAVLWRVQAAVKPETRKRRIAQLVDMLARGEVIHIFKPKACVSREVVGVARVERPQQPAE